MNFAILYCILWYVTHATKAAHFSLSSSYSIFPLSSISKWGYNQFWGWLTSSITSIMGNQVSLQIFMWRINGSQRIIDLKNCLKNNRSIVLKKIAWGKRKILPFCSLSGTSLWPMSSKCWCYEVFPIHHDLIYEPFDS